MKEKDAEKIFDQYLNNTVYPLVGNQTTYLSELYKAGRKLFGIKFHGVYPSDKIPHLNDLSCYCILNLDRSTQSGSHWIALAKIPDQNKSIVFDSFGRDYTEIIPILGKSGNGKIINTDEDQDQKVMETDCGARCLSFLMVFDKHGADVAVLI
jgi:hypothetical protein